MLYPFSFILYFYSFYSVYIELANLTHLFLLTSLLIFHFITRKKNMETCSQIYFFTSTILFSMAPHSGALAWKIPWMEEPGGMQFMGSLQVGRNWATSLSLFTFMQWRRKWQPTPVFLPGESQGQGSLVGCRLWGRTELDTTEAT